MSDVRVALHISREAALARLKEATASVPLFPRSRGKLFFGKIEESRVTLVEASYLAFTGRQYFVGRIDEVDGTAVLRGTLRGADALKRQSAILLGFLALMLTVSSVQCIRRGNASVGGSLLVLIVIGGFGAVAWLFVALLRVMSEASGRRLIENITRVLTEDDAP